MDDWQLRNLAFPPRDEEGNPLDWRQHARAEADKKVAIPFTTYKDRFWRVWKDRGLTDEQIAARWQEYLKKNPREAELETKREKARRKRDARKNRKGRDGHRSQGHGSDEAADR